MKLVTSEEMRALDRAAISKHKIPSLTLMEKAGRAVADAVLKFSGVGSGQIVIVCGKGNNGGDGLVAARYLIGAGRDVAVLVLSSLDELSPDARANFEFLAPLSTHIFFVTGILELNSRSPLFHQAACIIDAIFGTGLSDEVKDLGKRAIELLNSVNAPKISIDVPSGLDSDTGKPHGIAVRAELTVTLGLPKIGLFAGFGPDHAGKIVVADIGIPESEIERLDSKLFLIEPKMFSSYFGKREAKSHKGNYGHVAVFAGSLGHLGAGYLVSLAALRAGCGLVTYCIPQKAFTRFDARYPEIMCDSIPDDGTARFHPSGLFAALDAAKGVDVIAIGPAIGTDAKTREFLNQFIAKISKPVVIDADGLNALDLSSLRSRSKATILTPHPGEMARLLGLTTDEVQRDRLNIAKNFAKTHGVYLILKGANTIVATPDGRAAVNPTGNAGMATAGMGDALTGIIASFLAQGMETFDACSSAVYLHGLAGDIAAAELTERALITSDVIRCLSGAMKKMGAL